MTNKWNQEREEFYQLLRSTGRQGIDRVIASLDEIGFFHAPASSEDHMAHEGGLLEHSLNVYRTAVLIADAMRRLRPDVSMEDGSIKIAALLHDVCKAPRYRSKPEGGYDKDYTHLPLGHGEKSAVMLLRMGLSLTDAELLAIRWHMGPWQLPLHNSEQQEDYKSATLSCPLVAVIHTADTLAAQIIEV